MSFFDKLFTKASKSVTSKGKDKVGDPKQEADNLKKFDLFKEVKSAASSLSGWMFNKLVNTLVTPIKNMINNMEESTGIAQIKKLIAKIKSLINKIKTIAKSLKYIGPALKGLGIAALVIIAIFFIFSIFNAISSLFSFSYGFDKTQYYDSELFTAVKNKELMEENLYEKASETSYYQRFVDAGISDFVDAMLPETLKDSVSSSMENSKDVYEMAQKEYTGFYTMDSRLTIHDANFGSLGDYIQANTVDTDLKMSSYAQGYLRDYFNKEVNFTLSDQFLVELNNKAFAQNGQFGEDLQLIYPETFTKPIAFVNDYNRMEIVETQNNVFEWEEYTYVTQRITNEDIGKKMSEVIVNFNELNWAAYWGYSGDEISPDYVIQADDEGKICSYPSPYVWEYIVSDKDSYEYIDLNKTGGIFDETASIETVDNDYNSNYLVLYNETDKTYEVAKFYYKLQPSIFNNSIDCGLGDEDNICFGCSLYNTHPHKTHQFVGPYLGLTVNNYDGYSNCLSGLLTATRDNSDGFYYYTITIPNGYRLPEEVMYVEENGEEKLVNKTKTTVKVRADFNEEPTKHLQTVELLGNDNEVAVSSQNLINYKYYKFKTITESYRNQQEYIDGWANFLLYDSNSAFFTEMADRNFLDAMGARLSAFGTAISDFFTGNNSNANMEISAADQKNQKTINLISSYPSEVLDLSVYLYENSIKNDENDTTTSTNADGSTTEEFSSEREDELWKYDYSVNAYFKTDNDNLDAQEYYQKFFYVAEELQLAYERCGKVHADEACSNNNHSSNDYCIYFDSQSVIYKQVYNLVTSSQTSGEYLYGKEFDGDTIGNEGTDYVALDKATNNILTDLYEKLILEGEADVTNAEWYNNNASLFNSLNYLTNQMTTKYLNLGTTTENGKSLGGLNRLGEYSVVSTLEKDKELYADVLLFSGVNRQGATDPSGIETMTFRMKDWTSTLGDGFQNIFIDAYNFWGDLLFGVEPVERVDSSKTYDLLIDANEHTHLQYDYYFVSSENENQKYNEVGDGTGDNLDLKTYTSNAYSEYDYRLSKHGLVKLDTTNDLPMELKSVRDYGLGSVLNYVDSVVVTFKSGVYFDETYLGDEITKEIIANYGDAYRTIVYSSDELADIKYKGSSSVVDLQNLYNMIYEGYYPKEYIEKGTDRLVELFTQNNKKQLLINLAENVDDKITEMSAAYDEFNTTNNNLVIHIQGTGDSANTYTDQIIKLNRDNSIAGIYIDDISNLVIPTKGSKVDSNELEDQLVVFPYLLNEGELAKEGETLGGFKIQFNTTDIEKLAENEIYVRGNEFGYYTPYISATINGKQVSRISQLLFPKRYYRSWVETEETVSSDNLLSNLMKTVMLNSGYFQTTIKMPDKETALSSSYAANYGTIYDIAKLQDFNIENYLESTKYDNDDKINNKDDYVYYLCTQYAENAANFKGARYSDYSLVAENQLKKVFLIDEVVTFTGKFMYTYKDKLVALDTNSVTDITKGVIGTYATDRYVFLDSWDIKLLSDRIMDLSVMFFRTDMVVRVDKNEPWKWDMTSPESDVKYISLKEYMKEYNLSLTKDNAFLNILNYIEEWVLSMSETWGTDSSNSFKMDELKSLYALFIPAKYAKNTNIKNALNSQLGMGDKNELFTPIQQDKTGSSSYSSNNDYSVGSSDWTDRNYNGSSTPYVLEELMAYTTYIADGFMLNYQGSAGKHLEEINTSQGDTNGTNWVEIIQDDIVFEANPNYDENSVYAALSEEYVNSLNGYKAVGLQYLNWWRKLIIEKGDIELFTYYNTYYKSDGTRNTGTKFTLRDLLAGEQGNYENYYNIDDTRWCLTTTLTEVGELNSVWVSSTGDKGSGTLDNAVKGYELAFNKLFDFENESANDLGDYIPSSTEQNEYGEYLYVDWDNIDVPGLKTYIKSVINCNDFYNFNSYGSESGNNRTISKNFEEQITGFIEFAKEQKNEDGTDLFTKAKLMNYIANGVMHQIDIIILGGLFNGIPYGDGEFCGDYLFAGGGVLGIAGRSVIEGDSYFNASSLILYGSSRWDFVYLMPKATNYCLYNYEYKGEVDEWEWDGPLWGHTNWYKDWKTSWLVFSELISGYMDNGGTSQYPYMYVSTSEIISNLVSGDDSYKAENTILSNDKNSPTWALTSCLSDFGSLNPRKLDELNDADNVSQGYKHWLYYGAFSTAEPKGDWWEEFWSDVCDWWDELWTSVCDFFNRVQDRLVIDSSYFIKCLKIKDSFLNTMTWSSDSGIGLFELSEVISSNDYSMAEEMSGIFNSFVTVLNIDANSTDAWQENIPFIFTTYQSKFAAAVSDGTKHVGCVKTEMVVYTYTLKLADELALDIDYGRFYSQASNVDRMDGATNPNVVGDPWTDNTEYRNSNLNEYGENVDTFYMNSTSANYDAGELYTITAKDIIGTSASHTFLDKYNQRAGTSITWEQWENIWAPELKIYDNVQDDYYNSNDMKEYLYGSYLNDANSLGSESFKDFVVANNEDAEKNGNATYTFDTSVSVGYYNPVQVDGADLKTKFFLFNDFVEDMGKSGSILSALTEFFEDGEMTYNYNFLNKLFGSNNNAVSNGASLKGYQIQNKIYNLDDFNSVWPVLGYGTEDRAFNTLNENSDKLTPTLISEETEKVENFETRFTTISGKTFDATTFTEALNDLYNEKLYQAIYKSADVNTKASLEEHRSDFNITGFILVPRIADRRDEPTVYPLYRYFMGASKQILPEQTNTFFEGQTYDSWMDRMTIDESSTAEDMEYYNNEKTKLSEYLYSYLANFECYVPYNIISDSDLEVRGTAGYGDLMTNYTLYPQYTNRYTQYFVNEASKEYWVETLEKYDLSVTDLAQLLQGIAEVQLEESGEQALNILRKTAKQGGAVNNRVLISNSSGTGATDVTSAIPKYSEDNINILQEAILNTINSSGGSNLTVTLEVDGGGTCEYFLPIVGIAALDDFYEEDKEESSQTVSTVNTFKDFVFIGTFSSNFKTLIQQSDGGDTTTWKTFNYNATSETIYNGLLGNVPTTDTGIVLMLGAGDALSSDMDTNYARQVISMLVNQNPKAKIYIIQYPGFASSLNSENNRIDTFNTRLKNMITSYGYKNISFINMQDVYCEQGHLTEDSFNSGLNYTYGPKDSGTVFINQDNTFRDLIIDAIFGSSFGSDFDYTNGNIKTTKDLAPTSVGSIAYYDVDLEITKNNMDDRLDVSKSVQYLGVRLYKYVTKGGNFMKGLYSYFYGRDYINALSSVTADTASNLVKYPNHGLFYNPTNEDIANALGIAFGDTVTEEDVEIPVETPKIEESVTVNTNNDTILKVTTSSGEVIEINKTVGTTDIITNEDGSITYIANGKEICIKTSGAVVLLVEETNTEFGTYVSQTALDIITNVNERGKTLREVYGVERLKDCFSFIQNADSKKALSTNAVSAKYSVQYSLEGQLPAIDVDNPSASTQIVEIPIEAGQEKSFTYLKGFKYGTGVMQQEDEFEDWTDWRLSTSGKTCTVSADENGRRGVTYGKGADLIDIAYQNSWVTDDGRFYIEEDGVQYFLVALGSAFMADPDSNDSLGGKFVITTDEGNSWYAMQVDVKADRHTDTSNVFTAVAYHNDVYGSGLANDDCTVSRKLYAEKMGYDYIPVCVCEFQVDSSVAGGSWNASDIPELSGNIISIVPVQLADGSASGTYGSAGNNRNYAEEIWEEDYMKYQNTGLMTYSNHMTENDIEDLLNTTAIYRTGNENVSTYDYTLLDFFLNRAEADIEDLDFNGNIQTNLLKVAMQYLGAEYSQGIVANDGWSRYIAPNGIIYSRFNYHLNSMYNDETHKYAYVTAKNVAAGLESGTTPSETTNYSSEASRYAFDCSSYANYVYRLMGYELPQETCTSMIDALNASYPGNIVNYTSLEDLQPGDLMITREHVTIYMGEYFINLDAQFDSEDLLVESGNDVWYTGQEVLDWANAEAAGKTSYIHCGGSGLEGGHSCVNIKPVSDTYLTSRDCYVYRIFWSDYSSEDFNATTLDAQDKLKPSIFTSITIENNPYLVNYLENSYTEAEIKDKINAGDFTQADLDRAKAKINSVQYNVEETN